MKANRWQIGVEVFRKNPKMLVFSVYLILSTLLTWPLIFTLNSVLFGDFGDSRGAVAWIWAKAHGIFDLPVNHLVAAPFGVSTARAFGQPVLEWILVIWAHLIGEVAAYNLFVFLAFPLTAMMMFLFLDSELRSKWPAFVGGIIFGFCPAAVMQAAGGHTAFSFNMFVPLFLLSLFSNRRKRSVLSSFLVAVCFSLITFTAIYMGYFSVYILIFFMIFDFLSCRSSTQPALKTGISVRQRMVFINYLIIFGFICLIILPVVYESIVQQVTSGADVLRRTGQIRDISELTVYSSRPWDYILPSVEHPVLGEFVSKLVRSHLHGSNVPEQTLYLGIVPILLMLLGCYLFLTNQMEATKKSYFLFFVFGALLMYFVSLPPLIQVSRMDQINKMSLYTLSYFAYDLVPMFRVYARAGILVMFFVASGCAVVLKHYFEKLNAGRFLKLLSVLVLVLMFDFWSVPPHYALAVDQPPNVYKWLAEQPGDFTVAIYPMTSNDEFAFYTYLFWQRYHRKKMVNGAPKDSLLAWDFFQRIRDVGDPSTVALLKSVGTKYIIMHEKMYQEGIIPDQIKKYFTDETISIAYNEGRIPAIPLSLKFVKAFGSDKVYSIELNESGRGK